MTLATLSDVLIPARDQGYAVAGLVCQGWEDMRAYVAAAEAEGVPIILQAGPGCRAHTPLTLLGQMFRYLGDHAQVPVVAHLDHGQSVDDCRAAIDAGFTSVMFDGSALPLADNIARTRLVVDMAHAAGVSCEGEIGYVGYADGAQSHGTDPQEAATFAQETGVDAIAISVGNTHLQQSPDGGLDLDRIRAIEALTHTPLVIHGGSGVPPDQRRSLAHGSNVCKFNIGTELRMAFGAATRDALANDPNLFDRLALLSQVERQLIDTTRPVLANLR